MKQERVQKTKSTARQSRSAADRFAVDQRSPSGKTTFRN